MATGPGVPIIPQTQLDLGPAAWFRPEPENPPGNQVRVKFGRGMRGAFSVVDQPTDQLTAGFASVASGAGFKRIDLVFLDLAGVVQIAQGVDVAVAAPNFDGAPGFNLGPPMPPGSPVCYVIVTETGAVTVNKEDIFQVNGFISLGSDLQGYIIDKGTLASAALPAPSGASDDVSALFAADTKIAPVTGASVPNSGGNTVQAGVVTTPPDNYVHLTFNGDEILHVSGAQVYGRLTEAAGVWTLSYFYTDGAGAETAIADISNAAEVPVTPSDQMRLIGVPRVFSRNDPARPLFDSPAVRQSDQIAGDIPTATTTVQGKALAATASPAVPLIGSLNEASDQGGVVGGGPWHRVFFNAPPGSVVNAGGGVLQVNAAGVQGPTGPAGPQGPSGNDGGTGPAGPTGPGFNFLSNPSFNAANTVPTRSSSMTVNSVSNVKMWNATLHTDNNQGNAIDVYSVNGVSINNTNGVITINYSTNDIDGNTSNNTIKVWGWGAN